MTLSTRCILTRRIYPGDSEAQQAISLEIPIHADTTDDNFLRQISEAVTLSIDEFQPDLLIYNAGTDCLHGDPLGRLNFSDDCIVERDFIMFDIAIKKEVPIVMVTSGGYQLRNAQVIASSIQNLNSKLGLFK